MSKNFFIVAILVILGISVYAYLGRDRMATVDEMMVNTPSSDSSMMHTDEMMKPSDSMMHNDEMMKSSDSMMMHGSYVPYDGSKLALAKEGKVVLFFRASWCPTCRALDKDIRANMNSIPANVTILDVDYDNAKELKVKYGVTYQHTMVEVDADGTLIKKWSGSETLAALVSEIK